MISKSNFLWVASTKELGTTGLDSRADIGHGQISAMVVFNRWAMSLFPVGHRAWHKSE